MNTPAMTGKIWQMVFQAAPVQEAREIRAVSLSEYNDNMPEAFISSAPRQRKPWRYGGRVMRYRNLHSLKPWQVHMLHSADFTACALGKPLNTFVSILYEATAGRTTGMAQTFKRALKRMRQWFRDNATPCLFAYVHENPGDAKPNSHLIVHVPAPLRSRFAIKVPDWFDAIDGGVLVEPRNKRGRQDTRLQYMTKGADHLTAKRFGGFRSKGGQGPIHIKRAGCAQALRRPAQFGVIAS